LNARIGDQENLQVQDKLPGKTLRPIDWKNDEFLLLAKGGPARFNGIPRWPGGSVGRAEG
jgi:hypothetical protein